MLRFIFLSFAFLGWSFYELSGGANYRPGDNSRQAVALLSAQKVTVANIAPQKTVPAPVSHDAVVTLASASTEPAKEITPDRLSKNFIAAKLIKPAADETKVIKLTAPEQTEKIAKADIRSITGRRVNMRMGPGTNFSVAAKLSGGDQVEVVRDNNDGWLKLRVVETGRIGWMADFLVTAAAD